MMLAHAIKVDASDQGLAQILEVSQVHEPVIKYLKEDCGLKTTTDLLGYFAESSFESEIKALIEAKFEVKEDFKLETQRLYISRLRAAFKLSMETYKRIKAEASKPPEAKDEDNMDLERPLDQPTIDKLNTKWKDLHNLKFINFMRPGPQLRNRIFREIHMKVARMFPVEKVKSAEDYRMMAEPEKHDLGAPTGEGHLVWESARKVNRRITDCLEYLTALRVLMLAYAYCGSHQVAAADDVSETVVFLPFEAALGYVDDVTQSTLAMHRLTEHDRLGWLRKRDEQVRGEWVALINEGFSGGEALQKATSKLAHIWIINDGASTAAAHDDRTADHEQGRGQVRQRPDEDNRRSNPGQSQKKQKEKGTDVFEGVRRATKDKNSDMKFCGAWNGKKGCTWNEKNCPQRAKHRCNVILPTGEVCRSSQHNTYNHS